ncbi:hypothetical protein BWQ93_18525 [Sphingopyxis sp. QXT-31]|uniref:sulfotransferase family 2 domain-containing protein n=1 Tax=Sphingopyxis sp. QXT-31 TaxID=1357916 RepID=UPI00097972D4|nr:sulfotransferase family 2 domain-containing protein [Sphingopyxis sp. QXT-31]AQA00229.1 hypothetical protein BWQ93_18525 [Sphingopyxis sp. QXT-31]
MTDAARPLWIFLHVPKCGGTTLKAHLERHFVMDEQLVEFSHWGRSYRKTHGRPDFADRPPEERASAEILSGHQTYYGIDRLVPGPRDPRYFTVLRDPAERCVSLYNFRWSRGHAPDDFTIWYRDYYLAEQRNYMVRFFAEALYGTALPADGAQRLAMARQMLTRCWFVTTVDRWNEGLDFVCDAMGIPTDWQHHRAAGDSAPLPASHPSQSEVVARRLALDDDLRARIHADSPGDVALVDWVRARRWPLAD